MLHETNLVQVKSVAKAMLLMELHETEFSPAVVRHPFTSFGIVMIQETVETALQSLVQKQEDLHTWQALMSKRIEKADDAQERIFQRFSRAHGYDPNVGQRKLLSIFKDANPDALMDEAERDELNAHNADHFRAMS